jgi:hypothetical protein
MIALIDPAGLGLRYAISFTLARSVARLIPVPLTPQGEHDEPMIHTNKREPLMLTHQRF